MTRRDGLIFLAALLSAGAYIFLAAARGASGFPLDDAWIHQVYARNLGTRFEFSFFAGQPSAGSTSPLWTLLLSIGYLLRIDFQVWTYLLGIVLFASSATITARLANRLFPFYALRFTHPLLPLAFSLYILFEWHLAWSAASGMEILLFVFLSLLLLERFYAREKTWLVGLLAGLLTLTRPEGIVLAALVALGILIDEIKPQRHKEHKEFNLRALCVLVVQFGGGLGIVLAPYLLFNLATAGTLLPNTFYAKSAEYAVLFEQANLLARFFQLLAAPFSGAQILLLPGLIYSVVGLARQRQWRALIPFAWLMALPALYALRLPVAYQHGRYEMPIIPFSVLYGIWGSVALFERLRNRLLYTTWVLATAALLSAFWWLGASMYATDVSIIDCEMVGTAQWVAANVPAEAVVAAHDIGALGYYYQRPFIDLAGLATPEVIPFIRDEGRLRDFLFARHATFVVVFPDWYSSFSSDPRFVPVYQTDCAATRAAGEQNMIVYRIVR